MIAVLAGLMMAWASPTSHAVPQQVQSPVRPPVAQAPAQPAPSPMRVQPPIMRFDALRSIAPNQREAAVCVAHMELLVEKVTARGEDVESQIWRIQEYWQDLLPDPDGPSPVSPDALDGIKTAIEHSARANQDSYLRQLQACVTEAAAGGALDN